MKERRKFKRYDSSMPAQVEFVQSGHAEVRSAELCNIGFGGAFVVVTGDADIGTTMDLNIFDYENRSGRLLGVAINQDALNLKILGRVVRVDELQEAQTRRGVALEFTSPVRFAPLSRSERAGKI